MSAAIINIGLVFGIVQLANKFELEKVENTDYLRASYGTVQALNLLVLAYVYYTIQQKNDQTELVYNETKNVFDPKEVEVVKTTVKDYDNGQVRTLAFQTLMGAAIVTFMHLKFGYLRPLLLQSVMGLRTMASSQLFQVYILGTPTTGVLARPWKGLNSIGQTPGPTPKELKAKEKKEAKKKINRDD